MEMVEKKGKQGAYINKKAGRNSGIELLRILSLFMIFWMHGAASAYENTFGEVSGILIEVIGNMGVACFILISGYYGIRLNVKKMMHLDLMLVFFSWLGLLMQFVWGNQVGGETILSYLLPVIGRQSWYFTCYFALAFLSPFLNEMVEKMGECRLKQLLVAMLVIFSGVTTVFFFDINEDGGKGMVHMTMLYLIGRYLGVYQSEKAYETKKLAKVFFITAGINFALNAALYLVSGSVQNRYARDNSLFTIIQAVCVFLIFRNIYFENEFVNRLAKHVPAAFIFEWTMRVAIVTYVYNYLVCADKWYYVMVTFAIAVVLIAIGSAIDWLRIALLHKPETWLVDKIYLLGEKSRLLERMKRKIW